jgi:hypothetical protein
LSFHAHGAQSKSLCALGGQYFVSAQFMPLSYRAIMELRHMRYFVAVAEKRNSTRAAARLRLAQASLSRQIRTRRIYGMPERWMP